MGGEIFLVSGEQLHAAAVLERQGAVAVPFHLVRPERTFRQHGSRRDEHGRERQAGRHVIPERGNSGANKAP
jgi:hypothetical protein